ncbi:HD domain-containing phosphohydrolase [Psychrobium sp. 1_MG-2023]|uniref:HD domain-containing phosphohydrolase n=1 Tax=Psychrobium sp. 1_MG-2023 TaxID=3062624 RepID=UPI000C34A063|nr:HD domain-containing phosphohydrolase [Psychrobium sp. 1_MG-2023]MDP2560094.1 DUF3369 domain-containing protein [Psychrobium sp. 1_MG-2023]PKF56248.1 phosphodiesterase [Alteromonadales bacterium alter-6D02]
MNDMFLFSDDNAVEAKPQKAPWQVLVVDDEKDVHAVTSLALGSFEFHGRELELLHAYSAKEAKETLKNNADIALILLDVVMETDQAGLELAAYIRKELKNHSVRIVLRTGQPGQAPEHQVIRDYDINDYKNKTELTSAKLYTILYSNLRSYKDINTVLRSKAALERLIIASRGISSIHGLKAFVNLTLAQLSDLLHISDDKAFGKESDAYSYHNETKEIKHFLFQESEELEEDVSLDSLPEVKRELIEEATRTNANVYREKDFVMFCSGQKVSLIFYGKTKSRINSIDRNILNIFTENLISIIDNIYLHEVIDNSQKELIYRLGEVVESRSNETGYHVKRVAYYSALLGELVGLPDDEVELIKSASPLHDVGKIAIPDAVLNKPGKLDADEWEIMKTHALKGYNILNGAGLVLLDVAATIALTHHEKWDGSGYPQGLAKEDIHLYGRITAIADVFDALGSDRCYKKAWELDRILELFKEERGKHFDPRLIDLLMDNLDKFLEIRDRYKD